MQVLQGRPMLAISHDLQVGEIHSAIVNADKEFHKLSAYKSDENYLIKKVTLLPNNDLMLLLFNPWGTLTWTGAYSKNSDIWSEDKVAQKKC